MIITDGTRLASTISVDTLRMFAHGIGLGEERFSEDPVPCYELTGPTRKKAYLAGARPVPGDTFDRVACKPKTRLAHVNALAGS
jgi:hypothetical protein